MFAAADKLGRIFTPAPVNRHHPLNRGRVAWWLALPGIIGGRRFFDLMGLRHGTMTNMGSDSGWQHSVRSDAPSGVLFDGTDDQVNCGLLSVLDGAAEVAFSAWLCISAAQGTDYRGIVGNLTSSTGIGISLGGDSVGDRTSLSMIVRSGYAYSGTGKLPADGVWRRVTGVFNGNLSASLRVALYIDGRAVATTVGSNPPTTVATSSNSLVIGNDQTSAGRQIKATLDDVSLWSRALTATEVQQDYILSRQGYPGVLNRLSTRVYSIPSGVATLFRRSLTNRTGSRSAA